MITTLQALEIARAALMLAMGGDWTGSLAILPVADRGYVVRAVASVSEAGQPEDKAKRFDALVDPEGTLLSDVPELAPMPVPIWSGGSAIGALAALSAGQAAAGGVEFDTFGPITVELRASDYKVTFPQKLDPGERGDDLAYGALIDPKGGALVGEMVPQ